MEQKKQRDDKKPEKKGVEIRTDLEDAAKGQDLSYLSEFPQFSVDEGVKAGIPPPRKKSGRKDQSETDTSN